MTEPKLPHRKRVKHYNDLGHCRELTFSTYRRTPILTNDRWRCLFSEAIDRATIRHGYHLTAFVFMPEHVHLLVYSDRDASGIHKLLQAIKRPFSFRIKRILEQQPSPLLDRLTIRQRPGVTTFRFWQEGPGYDRNLDRLTTVLSSIDYLHRNPVRRGMVEKAIDWPWSSARWYEGLPHAPNVRIPTLEKLPAEFVLDTVN